MFACPLTEITDCVGTSVLRGRYDSGGPGRDDWIGKQAMVACVIGFGNH